MKKTLCLLFTILFAYNCVLRADGITNHWTPDSNMQYQMSFVGVVVVDDVEQYNSTLEVGAFCGNECRGSGLMVFFGDRYYTMFMIYSNEESDQISFRLYDHSINQELELLCNSVVTFENQTGLGDLTDPFQISFSTSGFVTITASENPSGAGQLSGAGVYQLDEEVNMIAAPHQGYWFLDWSENNEVLTINSTYSFNATCDRDFVANFKPIEYYWEPIGGTHYSMNVAGVVLIDGIEQYNPMLEVGAFCGDECRGREIAYLDTLTGRYVVPLNIVSNVISGETIDFKLYDHREDVELDVWSLSQIIFENDSIVGLDDEFYHFEFGSLYNVTAIVDPEGTGSVEGTGPYYWGTTATLTAIPAQGYALWRWLRNSEVVSTNNPYSFIVTGDMELVAKFIEQQMFDLVEGWNWWSTYIEQNDIDGLTSLEQSLSEYGEEIESQNDFVRYDSQNNMWYGYLSEINNEETYIINVSADCTIGLPGSVCEPDAHPITINNGWTWIGYPVITQQTPDMAMSTFNPTFDDVVKGQKSFAVYRGDYGWFPYTFVMTPGQGYKYHSNANNSKTLVYSDNGNRGVAAINDNNYWKNDGALYPNNMNVIAAVFVSDVEQQGCNIELGAFVDDECRGSAKLEYFEPLNRYYAMLTVAGNYGEKIEFSIVDTEINTISADCVNTLAFRNDAIVGTLDDPYEIRFGAMADIDNNKLEIYPNPIGRNQEFNVNVPMGDVISDMIITDVVGAVVDREKILVSGTYMIKVVCVTGNVYYGKLIVN